MKLPDPLADFRDNPVLWRIALPWRRSRGFRMALTIPVVLNLCAAIVCAISPSDHIERLFLAAFIACWVALLLTPMLFWKVLSRESLEELDLTLIPRSKVAVALLVRPVACYLAMIMPWVIVLCAAILHSATMGDGRIKPDWSGAMFLLTFLTMMACVGISVIAAVFPRQRGIVLTVLLSLWGAFWRIVALLTLVALDPDSLGWIALALLVHTYIHWQAAKHGFHSAIFTREAADARSAPVSAAERTPATKRRLVMAKVALLAVVYIALPSVAGRDVHGALLVTAVFATMLLPILTITFLRPGFNERWRGLSAGAALNRTLADSSTLLHLAVAWLLLLPATFMGYGNDQASGLLLLFMCCGMVWIAVASLLPRRRRAIVRGGLLVTGIAAMLIVFSASGELRRDRADSITELALFGNCLLLLILIPWCRFRLERERHREFMEAQSTAPNAWRRSSPFTPPF